MLKYQGISRKVLINARVGPILLTLVSCRGVEQHASWSYSKHQLQTEFSQILLRTLKKFSYKLFSYKPLALFQLRYSDLNCNILLFIFVIKCEIHSVKLLISSEQIVNLSITQPNVNDGNDNLNPNHIYFPYFPACFLYFWFPGRSARYITVIFWYGHLPW